jgi:hypothetical protein
LGQPGAGVGPAVGAGVGTPGAGISPPAG